ncbi:hypothetical protein [Henriciella marina]|uniref:hypothetical protein n=1 Tax=Henriciella marina TaxID=453851 RepID=UPI00037F7E43|nr:hypothetical protein [Henriciella marina]
MKSVFALAGAVFALMPPVSFAQSPEAAEQAPPPTEADALEQAQEEPINPMIAALQGLYVAILQNDEGGIASIQPENGDPAIIAFMTPQTAETQRAKPEYADLQVRVVDLAAILRGQNGAVTFQASAQEIANAHALDPEAVDFMAPVFFVTSDNMEVQLETPNGPITPVLTSYSDAETLAQKLIDSGDASEAVKIIPVEFASMLQGIGELEGDAGYRFFTHPQMVAAINSQIQPPAQPETPEE